MDTSDRPHAMAQWMWDARQRRAPYQNLPDELRPGSLVEAYAGQEAYYRLAEPLYGAVGGAKIATTTKVMQQLMGITHPCGGAIFTNTFHRSPARLRTADFVNLRLESEIALQLGADLPASRAPWTRLRRACGRWRDARVRAHRGPQRRLCHCQVLSLIVENCWNGGVVIGAPKAVSADTLVGIAGRLAVDGKPSAMARPRIPMRRSPGSLITLPNAGATSKPAWWSSPAVLSQRFRSHPDRALCSASMAWARLCWMRSETALA
jgi:2-keto-4-pentenoate hydratase